MRGALGEAGISLPVQVWPGQSLARKTGESPGGVTVTQVRQKAPRNDLFSGVYAVLHTQPEGQLQGWDAHREVTLAAQPDVIVRPEAANTTPADPGTGRRAQISPSAGTTPFMVSPETSARCRGCTGSSSVTDGRCSVAAAGQAAT